MFCVCLFEEAQDSVNQAKAQRKNAGINVAHNMHMSLDAQLALEHVRWCCARSVVRCMFVSQRGALARQCPLLARATFNIYIFLLRCAGDNRIT